MSITTTQQQTADTGQQPQTDEQQLKEARKALDKVETGDKEFYSQNKMRKKLKRWFDRCAKKKISEAKQGELCYDITDRSIFLGTKIDDRSTRPCLLFNSDGIYLLNDTAKLNDTANMKRINTITYNEFYPIYKQTVGRSSFCEGILNAWDGFMAITQIPTQNIFNHTHSTKSGKEHAVNAATRILSPVIAPLGGLCGGICALVPTKEELLKKAKKERNNYKLPLQKIQDNENRELKEAKNNHNSSVQSFNQWVDNVFKNHEYGNQTSDIVEKHKKWYQTYIIDYDLKEINKLSQSSAQQSQ